MTSNRLIFAVAAFLTLFGNAALLGSVLNRYPLGSGNALALASLIVCFGGATALVFGLLCFRRSTKPVLIAILLLSALAAYFMDSYGVIISDDMLRNIAQTHVAEALDLLNYKLLLYVVGLGILPALAVARVELLWRGWRVESLARLKLLVMALVFVVSPVLVFGNFYASFLREHKDLRQRANPLYYLYSLGKLSANSLRSVSAGAIKAIGIDAMIPAADVERELIILVVGETARADRFSLNGYSRETNPRLREKNVLSFSDFQACGTSTAVSVPCMFLLDGKSKESGAIKQQENLLDVLQRSGVNVLWRDNNSGSKGVADRVQYADFSSPKTNPVCDTECRDEGMLSGLQDYIDAHPRGDILIVLHQLGSHGPAYHKRYPPAFEKFSPACKESDLSRCSREEISNAYDNTILYTDHFLAKAIGFLQKNDRRFETALFYVSDHGESLGENGLYLHGLPKAIAPVAQLHVPALMWFGSRFHGLTPATLRDRIGQRYSHENLFHTVLGFFEIETAEYRPELDILHGTRSSYSK